MAGSAILSVRILGDAAGAIAAFDAAERNAANFQTGLDKASIGAGVALTAMVGFGGAAVSAASEAEQSMGAVQSVFGDTADEVLALADAAAQTVGLSTNEYNELASVFGAQLTNMGVSSDQLAGQTDDLIGMGADLAATFGGSTSDAVSALSSLLRGERDPIEQFGVSIKQADIEAQKAAMGLDGLTGEADRAADMQATLALLTDQTTAAQGQFGREADTAAGQTQRMQAELANTTAELGVQLLPLLSAGAQLLSEFAGWVSENQELVTGLAIAVGVIATAIIALNIALKAHAAAQVIVAIATKASTAATKASTAATAASTIATRLAAIGNRVAAIAQGIATAAQWAFNVAASANPVAIIILVVIAVIALLVAAIIWLWNNWEAVTQWIGEAWTNVTTWLGDVWSAFTTWIVEAWQSYVVDPIIAAWNTITGAFQYVVDLVKAAWEVITAWLTDAWQTNVVDPVTNAWDTVGAAFEAVGGWIESVIDGIIGTIQNMIGWITDGINGFLELIGLGNDAPAAPAQAAITPTGLPGAPIWATMATDYAGSIPRFETFAPGARALAPELAASPRRGAAIDQTVTYNINVTGAIDEDATARKIQSVLRKHQQRTGAVVTAGSSWR